MQQYLNYKFEDTPQTVSAFDEAPLWSISFGLLMLKHLEYKTDLTILDIGSGTGFPLLEIANRFGNTCKCYGLDTWTNANNRAREKATSYALTNVDIIDGSASSIPFGNDSIDLIVSNLGINNFDDRETVFKECHRVLKPGGKLAITTNMNGHWAEFYNNFATVLEQAGKPDIIEKLRAQEHHRGNIETISSMFTNAGFTISRHYIEEMKMNFADGSAFLNHYFVKLGWLSSFTGLVDEQDRPYIFNLLEESLNALAKENGGLSLTVPMAFIEGINNV